jgi:tetratricopeptide (TPR) repeat protein
MAKCCWLVAVISMFAALAQPARAQVREANSGFRSRATGTSEIDTCRRPPGIDDREAENRAADHYDRGLRLYEQGDYEAAIEEFISAYCLTPYYRVLKDIAQSFERMVNYEKAVAYLERYLRETPADQVEERRVQAARMEVLRGLPARIRVATMPPGAKVTLRNQDGRLQAFDRADGEDPIPIPEGSYVMTVEQEGYETIARPIEVEIGQPYSYYFQLEPKKGTLRLVVVPASARIFVDKRWVAVGSYVDELPLGKYLIEIEAAGYRRASRPLELNDAATKNLTIELEPLPRSGRLELITASTLGGGLWGNFVFSSIFGEDDLLGSAGAALGLGLGFGGAYLGVPRDIAVEDSSYIIGGALAGAMEGALLASLVAQRVSICPEPAEGDMEQTSTFEKCNTRIVLGAGIFGNIGGAVFATLTAPRFDLSAGDVAIINTGALWGTVTGGLLWRAFDQDQRVGDVLGLTSLNLGLLAGIILAQRTDYSRSHVGLIDLGGLGGLLMGGLLASVLTANEEDSGDRQSHYALIGMASGLIISSYLTRDMDEPAKALPRMGMQLGQAADTSGRSIPTVSLGGAF